MLPLLLWSRRKPSGTRTQRSAQEGPGKGTWPRLSGEPHTEAPVRRALCRSLRPQPPPHLYVLSDPLLVVALGQDHNPTLQLVAQGDQGWSSLVLFGQGTKNRIFQENWGARVHPGRTGRNAELLRLRIGLSGASQTDSGVHATPVLLRCGSPARSTSITWDVVRNVPLPSP